MRGAKSCNGVDWSIVQSKHDEIAHGIIDVIGSVLAHTSEYHGRGLNNTIERSTFEELFNHSVILDLSNVNATIVESSQDVNLV